MTKGERVCISVGVGLAWFPLVSTGSCRYRCSLSAATHYHSKQVPLCMCVCVCEQKTDNKS